MINNIDTRTKLIIILTLCVFAIYFGITNEYFILTDTIPSTITSPTTSPTTTTPSKTTTSPTTSPTTTSPTTTTTSPTTSPTTTTTTTSPTTSPTSPTTSPTLPIIIPSETKPNQECATGSLNSCSMCKSAYENYNLYPSTNPFVVRGNDLNTNFKNIITDSATLSKIGTKNYGALNNLVNNYNPNNDIATSESFNILLQQAPLKAGCCLKKKDDTSQKTSLVRTPLSPNDTVDPLFKKFDFKFKSIPIPEESCPVDYYSGSPNCNAFYDVYSQNMITQLNKQGIEVDNFLKYAPECACYAPRTKVQEVYPDNTPPACYKTNCDVIGNPTAYVDPISRSTPCDITVCNNVFNATIGNVGGNVTINPKLENSCGKFSPSTANTNTENTNKANTNKANTANTGDSNSSTIVIVTAVVMVLMLSGGGIYFAMSGAK